MNKIKPVILGAAMLSLLIPSLVFSEAQAAERIPGFMKKNIEWYSQGVVSEQEFVNALTYLMNQDIIVLDQEKADAIKQLRDENQKLREQLGHELTHASQQGSLDKEAGLVKFGDGEHGNLPPSSESESDKYGRIKAQFHWDTANKEDVASFTSEIYAEKIKPTQSQAMVWIPVIEDELLVSFENGDPDRPIIIGRVYNAETMPSHKLPDGKILPGMKSVSAPGGGYNEMKMDDTAGKEMMQTNNMISNMQKALTDPATGQYAVEKLQKQLASAETETMNFANKLQTSLDAKAALREDISELRDAISNNVWPIKFTYATQSGDSTTVALVSIRDATSLLVKLESQHQTMGEDTKLMQLELQNAMQKQQQALQTLSNILKTYHDTAKSIINNLK